jgi:predicted nucleic acid-binding protein
VSRRRRQEPAPPAAVLDSEALSALARPNERGITAKRAQAVLEAVERRGGVAHVPAPILAEVSRGSRHPSVARVLAATVVVPTDRNIAERAGALLERHQLGSCHAVDAFVVATAAAIGNAVVLTTDPDDLRRLAEDVVGIAIQPLP